MRQEIRERKSPKGGRHLLGALGRMDSSLAAPFHGGRAKAAPPLSPGTLYIVGGEGGQQYPSPWRLPLPPVRPLPLAELGEALPRSPMLPPLCRRAAGSPSTSPPPLLDQGVEYVTAPYVC